jgi:quinol monooxygenase YgiN
MSKLQVTAQFKIHAGKQDEFKELAAKCLTVVKDKDKDTLQYDWYFNADHTECVVRETYADSNAVFAHMTNLGELFGKILQISDMSLEVYGDPSEEVKKAIADMHGKIYSFYQGL